MKTLDYAALVAQARIDSPLGPLTAVATTRGVAGLWFDGQRHHPGALALPLDPMQPHLAQLRDELQQYWSGQLREPFRVALDPHGTAFQKAVWRELLRIGCGRLSSYGELAAAVGRPAAARAVGAAVGRNPISIVIPCHRVLGRNGSLTGYAGGLARKQALLALERQPPQQHPTPETRRPPLRAAVSSGAGA